MCWVSELLSLKIVHHTKKVSLSPSSSCFSAFQAYRAGNQIGSEQKKSVQTVPQTAIGPEWLF